MTPEDIAKLFTRPDGSYAFARWERPIVPVVFGTDDATLQVFKGAAEALAVLSGHKLAETDPELGANLMVFCLQDWTELLDVPNIEQLLPERDQLVKRLRSANARHYRLFRFEENGAIKACFSFLRFDAALLQIPAEDLALAEMAQAFLPWAAGAFEERAILAQAEGHTPVLNPEFAGVIKAAYDPLMPVAADDPSHALRIFARVGVKSL